MPVFNLFTPLRNTPALRPDRPAVVKLAALLFLPAALGVSVLAYVLLKADTEVRLQTLQVQEAGEVKVAANLLSHNLGDVVDDLRFLARTPALQRFVESHDKAELARLSQHFVNLSQSKARYDQVRYMY